MMNCKSKNIKWQYYAIQNIITKSKFGNIIIINIMMYVSIIIIYNPYLLQDIILGSHKIFSSQKK